MDDAIHATHAGNAGLGTANINEFVDSWFALLSAHAPVDELIPYLSATELEMEFPERTLRNLDDFREWYAAVGNTYTNQHHELQQLDVGSDSHNADRFRVDLVVVWTAFDVADGSDIAKRATQEWLVLRDSQTGQLTIQAYRVLTMTDAKPENS